MPGTLTEANAIQKPITHYAKANPTVWLGRDASELNYMKLQSPKILVLSTHGYFLAQQPIKSTRSPANASPHRARKTHSSAAA